MFARRLGSDTSHVIIRHVNGYMTSVCCITGRFIGWSQTQYPTCKKCLGIKGKEMA